MVEYVYARHDFVPEHEDEIAFRAGERIEIVERDDLYSDGWWQVRSFGRLFASRAVPSPSPRSTVPLPASATRPHGLLEASVLLELTSLSSYAVSCTSSLPLRSCRTGGPCTDESPSP
jgi:hypothetical protein